MTAVIFSFLMIMSGCTTTRQVNQKSASEQLQVQATQITKVVTASETNTGTKTTAETLIKETFDTVVRVWPVVDGKLSDKPVDVPVKGERTIHRKEFTDLQQVKKEQGGTTVNRKEQLDQKSESVNKDKAVTRSGLPWWVIATFAFVIFSGLALLIWRFKYKR